MKLEVNGGKEELMKKEENISHGDIVAYKKKKKREGNGRKYLEKENIFLAEKKKNPEGIEGK